MYIWRIAWGAGLIIMVSMIWIISKRVSLIEQAARKHVLLVWTNKMFYIPFISGLLSGIICWMIIMFCERGVLRFEDNGRVCLIVLLVGIGFVCNYVFLKQHPLVFFTPRQLFVCPFYGFGKSLRCYDLDELSWKAVRKAGVVEAYFFYEHEKELVVVNRQIGKTWADFCRFMEDRERLMSEPKEVERDMDSSKRICIARILGMLERIALEKERKQSTEKDLRD